MSDNIPHFKGKYIHTIGRRKTATATVRMYQGSGLVFVNDKPVDQYFTITGWQEIVYKPFELTGNTSKFDLSVKIVGGGQNGQAGALKLAIARALVLYNEENRSILRKTDMLKRDPRMKERKKPGLHRARRATQFSKR
ncbi:MAG TPA: 30S ribosomal protein S9 [bacterium]|nr:30S ribosomal protein S9 [bacterium]HPN67527.1 30S ribosomal protein S9 [bacterium]